MPSARYRGARRPAAGVAGSRPISRIMRTARSTSCRLLANSPWFEIEVILETDTAVTTLARGLGDDRKFHTRNTKRAPVRFVRQQSLSSRSGFRASRARRGECPRQSWNIGAPSINPSSIRLLGEHDMPGLEHFQLGLDAKLADTLGHDAQMRRRVNKNGFAEIKVPTSRVQISGRSSST